MSGGGLRDQFRKLKEFKNRNRIKNRKSKSKTFSFK